MESVVQRSGVLHLHDDEDAHVVARSSLDPPHRPGGRQEEEEEEKDKGLLAVHIGGSMVAHTGKQVQECSMQFFTRTVYLLIEKGMCSILDTGLYLYVSIIATSVNYRVENFTKKFR